MPFCPECGKEYTVGQSTVCEGCGSDLSVYEQSVPEQQIIEAAPAEQSAGGYVPTSDGEILRRFARSALVTVTTVILAISVLAGLASCVFGVLGMNASLLDGNGLEMLEEIAALSEETETPIIEDFINELEMFLNVSEEYSEKIDFGASLLFMKPPVFQLFLLVGLLMFIGSSRREEKPLSGIGFMRTSANLSYILLWVVFAVALCGLMLAMPWWMNKFVTGFYGVFSSASSKMFLTVILIVAVTVLIVLAIVAAFATVIGAKSSKMLRTWRDAAKGNGELAAPVSLQVLLIIMAVMLVEDLFIMIEMGLVIPTVVEALNIASIFLFAFCIGKLRKMKAAEVKAAAAAMQPAFAAAQAPMYYAVPMAVPAETSVGYAGQVSEDVSAEGQEKPEAAAEQSSENSEG